MGITALTYTIAVCEGRCEKIDFIKGKRTSCFKHLFTLGFPFLLAKNRNGRLV